MKEQSLIGDVKEDITDYDLMSIYMIRLGTEIDENNDSQNYLPDLLLMKKHISFP